MTFRDLNIIEPILKAIEEKGYIAPTSIQEKAIPAALAKRDILGLSLIHICWLARENKICIQRKNGLIALSDESTFPFSFG